MVKAFVLAMSAAIGMSAAQTVPPHLVRLRELTLPPERLTPECDLAPRTIRLEGNRVLSGLWAGLPITTNPWIGTDRPVVASIRERVDGPALLPDGPPLTPREFSRFRLHLADGVEEAYAAIYKQSDPERELVILYGLRFPNAEIAAAHPSAASKNPRIIQMVIGPVVAVVHGDGGQCFQTVGAHLKSLAK